MLNIAISILGFIVAVSILTVVHELGHFCMARFFNVRVLRFSLGFGKPLLTWHDKLGTEYVVSRIPLGGYIKLLDERDMQVNSNELQMTFNRKSVWRRMAIITAGPFANLCFACVLYWLLFMVGVTTAVPIVGNVLHGTVADLAGIEKGQEIVQVDEIRTRSWEDVSLALMRYLGESEEFAEIYTISQQSTNKQKHMADLSGWELDNDEGHILKSIGVEPFDPVPPIVGNLFPGYPAEKVGIQVGDKIILANGKPVQNRSSLTKLFRVNANKVVHLAVERDNELVRFAVKPVKKLLEGGDEVGFVGIYYKNLPWPKQYLRIIQLNPVAAFIRATEKTHQYIVLTFEFIGKMVSGKVSTTHLAGPISIAVYAGESARAGIEAFITFLAIISISIGIVNLLPIPLLDGGQLFACLIETIYRRPIPEKVLEVTRVTGLALLITLVILVIYNDLMRF